MTDKIQQAKALSPAQIKSLFDLLALQCRAGLIGGDAYHKRRRELYGLAHESIKAEELGRVHNEATCFFCKEEEAERRAQNAQMDSAPLVKLPGKPVERIRGIRI